MPNVTFKEFYEAKKEEFKTYGQLGKELGELVSAKQFAYGDSVGATESFLRLLYPQGIPVEKYRHVHLQIRVFDKLMRIAHQEAAFGENPWQDIAGYGLLGMGYNNGKP